MSLYDEQGNRRPIKVGDLVKRRLPESALSSKAMSNEKYLKEPGIVIEVAENACKVIFPSLSGNIRSFLKGSLQVITK